MKNSPTNEYLDSLSKTMLLPYILLPTRNNSNSKTLIDNIFSNFILNEVISGNLTETFSGYLPEFLIATDIFCNPPANKTNIFEKNWSKFNHENFILDYFDINWPNDLKLDMQNVKLSLNNFYEVINDVLDKHAPYQKVTKYILKLENKPWITAGIQNSTKIENKLFKTYSNKKDIALKMKHMQNIRSIEICSQHLIKKSKKSHCDSFF